VNQYLLGEGLPFLIVLVPRYKLSLCHTSIKPDLLGFLGIGVTMWSWGSYHLVSELGSINQVISFWIFCSCCFRKNSLVSNFFFSLILQYIKRLVILFDYCPKYISSIKKRKEKRKEKKSFKETFIGFYHKKLNKGKLD